MSGRGECIQRGIVYCYTIYCSKEQPQISDNDNCMAITSNYCKLDTLFSVHINAFNLRKRLFEIGARIIPIFSDVKLKHREITDSRYVTELKDNKNGLNSAHQVHILTSTLYGPSEGEG